MIWGLKRLNSCSLQTCQRSWFTQILTPWASQGHKNLKWKIWKYILVPKYYSDFVGHKKDWSFLHKLQWTFVWTCFTLDRIVSSTLNQSWQSLPSAYSLSSTTEFAPLLASKANPDCWFTIGKCLPGISKLSNKDGRRRCYLVGQINTSDQTKNQGYKCR